MAIVQLLQSIRHADGKDLFAVDFDGIEVIFSILPLKTAAQLNKVILLASENETLLEYIYQYIFSECVTNDCLAKKRDDIPAGIVSSVAQTILYLSGATANSFEYTELLLEVHRESVENLISSMKRYICMAFPSYQFEHLDLLNYQEFIEIFANAEQSLLERGIITSRLEITSTKEKQQKKSISEMIQEDANGYNKFNNSAMSPGDKAQYNLNNLRANQGG